MQISAFCVCYHKSAFDVQVFGVLLLIFFFSSVFLWGAKKVFFAIYIISMTFVLRKSTGF
jgi:hypothetical protein